MNKKILSGLVIVLSAVIVISFFLPWAKVNISAMGISEELTKASQTTLKGTPIAEKVIGKLKGVTAALSAFGDIDVKTQVSGYNIPNLVNSKGSKVALSLAEIMFKSADNLDVKSYLVYLLPILGILCGVAVVLGMKNKLFIIAMLIVSGVVSLGGFYNLLTANMGNIAVKVTIMNGLWFTMTAFLFIFFIGIAWIVLAKE